MRATFYISSLILFFGLAACNSSNNNNEGLIDTNTKVLNLSESLEYVNQLLDNDPGSAELLLKKAEILYDLSLYDDSFNVLSQIDKPVKNIRYKILEIQLNLQKDSVDKALLSAENLYNNEGIESIKLNEQLAYLYAEKKDYLKAIDHINYCIDKNAGYPKYSYLKGLYYYNFKDTLNAYLYLEKALDNGYEELNGIILYIDLLLASDKPDQAFELVNEYIQQDPDNGNLKNSLAKVLNIKQNYIESKKISFDLIRNNYQNSGPYLNLADVYLDTYQYDSAIYFAEIAIELDKQLNDAYYVLGKAHRAKEQVYNAYNAYSEVLEYDPGDPYALAEMKKLENYIAYLQRIKREYESRPVLPILKPKSIEN